MAYNIVKGATVWWPVNVPVAVDGGGIEHQTFDVKFKRLDSVAANAAREMQNVDWLFACAADWRGIVIDGRPAAFDAETAAIVMGQPAVPTALGLAWASFLNGQPETRLGNSDPSAAGGPAAAGATAAAPSSAAS